GRLYSGLVATDDRLAEELLRAAAAAGEQEWRLPADPAYRAQYTSDVADVKNTGGPDAGAITGAPFTGALAGDAAWARQAIAGTAFAEKERAYTPRGGTGVAVRTLVRWLMS